MKVEILFDEPRVYYSFKAWHKIWHLVDKCKQEVGWWGTVTRDKFNFTIHDIFIPTQTVHGSETDTKPEDLNALFDELDKQGVDTDQLLYYGHSHVNMTASPSASDVSQTEDYASQMPYVLQGTYNKRGDSRVDLYDFSLGLRMSDISDTILIPELDASELTLLDEQIKERVKEAVFKQRQITTYQGGALSYTRQPGNSDFQPNTMFECWSM